MTGRPAGVEGRIEVRLRLRDGRVAEVAIRSARPVAAASVLAGRPVAEALRLAPLLFAVCGAAHAAALARACAAAIGEMPADDAHLARRVRAEALAGHLRAVLIDWPRALGEAPDPAALAAGRTALAALAGNPETAATSAAQALDAAVLGRWPAPEDWDTLLRWADAAPTPAARLFRYALDPRRATLGAGADVAPLPVLPAAWFGARLAMPGFSSLPNMDGRPARVGPLAALADHPLVAAVVSHTGTGLLAHLAARLAALTAGVAALSNPPLPLSPELCAPETPGTGAGLAETSRGPLAYRVRVEAGMLTGVQTVAPTEWNFHPEGAVASGLRGAPAGPTLERDAGLLVAALDPCVAWTLDMVKDAQDAHSPGMPRL